MTYLKIIYLVFLTNQINFLVGDPIITLPTGQIDGRQAETIAGTTFYVFEGIPYAAPPVGDLRFEAPQPPPSWDDVRDATSSTVTCFQRGSDSDSESEDCLFINVYTPRLPLSSATLPVPVMLMIHGGGFVDGSGVNWGPDLFIDNGVILATINYRLGVFGFISTEDDVIPGNNGLKDQHLAIQWVHDNIRHFGGDPGKVTIFGQSAGSASCAYQLLNQDNNDLFQSAILESGSFLSPWAYQRNSRYIAFKTASYLDASFENGTDSSALLAFLKTVDARALDGAATQFTNYQWGQGYQFDEISQGFFYAPVVEVRNPTAFITRKMFGLLNAGNVVSVPIMIGISSEENLAFNTDPNAFEAKMQTYDQYLQLLVPDDMEISDEASKVQMGQSIRELYTNGEPLADHLGDALRYSSDTSFTRSIIKHAELFSNLAETYFYQFSYDGEMGGNTLHYDGADNVTHGEELGYLFCSGSGCNDGQFPESDRVTRQRLIKLWTDFAKYKQPTPEPSEVLQNLSWPAVMTDGGDFWYLDILENLEIKNHPKEATYSGWIDRYDSLNFTDFDTF